MATATPYFTWENALQEYLLHTKATRAKKTLRYYEVQLGQLVKWADANDVPFESFGKRHLDRYLIFRTESGLKPLTVHHDAICANSRSRVTRKPRRRFYTPSSTRISCATSTTRSGSHGTCYRASVPCGGSGSCNERKKRTGAFPPRFGYCCGRHGNLRSPTRTGSPSRMTWRTHVSGGVSCLWLFLPLLPGSGMEGGAGQAAFCLLFGSLLPDLDASESHLARLTLGTTRASRFQPFAGIAALASRAFGHWGFLHSVAGLAASFVLLAPALYVLAGDWLAPASLAAGYVSHLALDALTPHGVPLWFPRRQRVHLLPKTFGYPPEPLPSVGSPPPLPLCTRSPLGQSSASVREIGKEQSPRWMSQCMPGTRFKTTPDLLRRHGYPGRCLPTRSGARFSPPAARSWQGASARRRSVPLSSGHNTKPIY